MAVLRATFGFPKADILSAFERLGQIPGLEFFNVDAVRNAIAWLQPCATTTRVTTPIESVELACNFGMSHLPSLTGTTEGERGVMRSEGLNDAFATITVVVPPFTVEVRVRVDVVVPVTVQLGDPILQSSVRPMAAPAPPAMAYARTRVPNIGRAHV